MIGALEGWQEPEYDPATGRSWRWMSDRASFWVRQVGRDVIVAAVGANRRCATSMVPPHFGSPPVRRSPSSHRQRTSPGRCRIPAAASSPPVNEVVSIESDRSFVAGGGDQRKLALRVYRLEIN